MARTVLASLAGLAVVASVNDASAFAVKKTTKGELVHWESDSVGFTIDPSVEQNVTSGAEATKEAMSSWSGTVGAPDIAGNTPVSDSPTKPAFDHKNGVFYAVGGYAPAGQALAITVLTYDNTSGKILDADVVFNGAYSFAVLPASAHGDSATGATDAADHDSADEGSTDPGTIYDLHHVVAHELGHSLGMNDEMQNKSALMYKYTSPDDATLRGPASDDVTGLAELYADKSNSTSGSGCGSATIAPKNPSKSASNAAMLATLGLLLFLVVRARSDRRARLAFVLASAAACVAFMPSLTGGKGVAQASTTALNLGHARAKVHASSVAIENGLFKTSYELTTTTCRADACPRAGHGITYGGTVGNITQEVGGRFAPNLGDEVDVSFKNMPNRLAAVSNPLSTYRAAIATDTLAEVKLVTRAAIAN